LKSRRLFAAVVLAVLAALVLALPAISVPRAQDTTNSEPTNTEETTGETTSGPPAGNACPEDETPRATLTARLTGEKEVPGPGDPDGSGRATVELFSGGVCYELEFEDVEGANAAHIHLGLRDEAGPVIVTLFDEESAPTDGSSSGFLEIPSEIPRALSLELREHPGRYYVNVHSEKYPDGAIRGQLRNPR
jgi:hypothetical protein